MKAKTASGKQKVLGKATKLSTSGKGPSPNKAPLKKMRVKKVILTDPKGAPLRFAKYTKDIMENDQDAQTQEYPEEEGADSAPTSVRGSSKEKLASWCSSSPSGGSIQCVCGCSIL